MHGGRPSLSRGLPGAAEVPRLALRAVREPDGAGAPLLPGSHEEGRGRIPGPGARGDGAGARRALTGRLLVVAGPTGTGKSEVAIRVAEALDGEIVGCDALQVYRGFEAATAKPDPVALSRVPHHLVSHVDPRRDYSLADYVRDADAAIAGILSRGRVPVVAGGTGMYLRGLLRGIVEAPPRDPAVRDRLRRLAERRGSARLHRLLGRCDPESARRLPPGDGQRIVRALEIAFAGGSTWSARLRESGSWSAGDERYPSFKAALDLPAPLLGARLDARVEAFFARGLVDEVRRLLAEGVPKEANAFKAIGYREVLRAILDGADPSGTVDAVRGATRRYAKRQRTWFRGERDVVWVDASAGEEATAEILVERWRSTAS